MTSDERPLAGVRVVEIGNLVSAPLIGLLLADFGADVIKVERPGSGDDSRRFPPMLDGEGAMFLQSNRNKRSVAVDMKQPAGQEIVRDLAVASDVVIDNLRPGALARLGLDYATLSTRNPRIITCSVTGYGVGNAYTERAGLDPILQAMSGLMMVTGFDGDPPTRAGAPVIDLMAAAFGALGINLALRARDVTGRGQEVITSLLGAATFIMGANAFSYWASGVQRPRARHEHRSDTSLIQVATTADGRDLTFALSNYAIFERLARAGERAELIEDERFSTMEGLASNADDLRNTLSEMFATRDFSDWATRLDAAGVPWGPVNTVPQFLDDPVVRDAFVENAVRATGNEVPAIMSPIALSDAPLGAPTGPPQLGEHTDEVLEQILGYSGERIAQLRRDAVVA